MVSTSFRIEQQKLPDNTNFFKCLMDAAKQQQLDSQLTRHNFELTKRQVTSLSLHQLLFEFVKERQREADDFVEFAQRRVSKELCDGSECMTRHQSESALWFELRYCRVTASKLHQAAQCQTSNASFVNSIIGVAKKFDNPYMARGRSLESKVLVEAETKLRKEISKIGLLLIPAFPMLGASPDGIGDDFVLEIKCPATAATVQNYLNRDEITKKYEAQIMLQMLAANMKNGVFCIADPRFEKINKIQLLTIDYEETFTFETIRKAVKLWNTNILPTLMKPFTL